MRNVCAFTDRRRFRHRIAPNLVVTLRELTGEHDGDEVQHDRVDNFMRAELCFQHTWNPAPHRTGEYGSQTAERNQQPRREIRELDSHPCSRKRCDVELSLRADVKKAATKADKNRETCED